jgi:hypothetical protein
MAADDAVVNGQSYTFSTSAASRTLTRADAALIRENIEYWEGKVKRLTRGGLRIRGATPV